MALWENLKTQYPDADPLFLLRIAQNKIGTDMLPDVGNSSVSALTGAPDALAALSAGKRFGEKSVDVNLNPIIARGEADQRNQSELDYAGSIEGAKTLGQPLPSTVVSSQDSLIDAVQTHKLISAKMKSFVDQIDSGQLDLNIYANAENKLRNGLSLSTQESRNLASFKAEMEALRNDSLRLNSGVQTEGDAIRAWNELVQSLNDPGVVRQRLNDISRINDTAAYLKNQRLDQMRSEYGRGPVGDIGIPANALPSVNPGAQNQKVINGKTYTNIDGQWFEQ